MGLSDRDLQTIAELDVHVAYCPMRVRKYFHAAEHFGPHRYRELGSPWCQRGASARTRF